jgi:phage/plasmid-associated DNA primase
VDEAIRRRFNLIPFSVHIPPEERDPALPQAA